MNSKIGWKPMLAGGMAALVLTFGTAAIFPQVSQAVDSTPAAPQQLQRGGAKIDRNALLADALGISTDELQAAYTKALGAALDKAVEEQLLTQKQADALRERIGNAPGFHGFGGFGFEHYGRMGGTDIDFQALLADALRITVEDLQAAQATAETKEIDQMVTDGVLTQEQADLAKARRAFQSYLAKQQPTLEEQLKQAVTAGAITQEQADLLLKNQQSGAGMWDHGMMGPGMRERGMEGFGMPFGPGMDGSRGRGYGDHRGMPFGNDGSQDNSGQPQDNSGQSQGSLGQLLPANL